MQPTGMPYGTILNPRIPLAFSVHLVVHGSRQVHPIVSGKLEPFGLSRVHEHHHARTPR